MKKKLLLIQPTIYDDSGKVIKKSKLYFIGLAFPLLAAMTPDDWDVSICLETIEDIPFDTDADLIGIGGMGHAANRAKDIARELRKSGKTVIMGGPMASLAPEIAKLYFDSIVIGDAETVWLDLLSDFSNDRLKPFYKREMDRLVTPLPRYDLITSKNIGDFLPVQAGRGCPNVCSFCSIYCMYRTKYFRRDIADVMRDIRYVRSLGFKKFLLIDDNIVSDREYVYALCKEIAGLGMKWMTQCAISVADDPELLKVMAGSGCYTLSLGLESINPASLKRINKAWCDPERYSEMIRKIVDAGIDIASEMIVGIDDDTVESLEGTVRFVEKTAIIAPKFYIMTPIPGTDLYKEMAAQLRIIEKDVFLFSPSRAVITHPNMSTATLNGMFWLIYERLYTIGRILRRCVFHRRFFKDPGRYLFYLFVNLFYRRQIRKRIAPIIM